jgi:hypothetical protein
MIRRAKWLELIFKKIIIDLSTFGYNVFFTLKIMEFENVALTKKLFIFIW